MPYLISQVIRPTQEGLWREGNPYTTQKIYDIHSLDPKLPPVNYDAHIIKPHSLSHMDAPAHTLPNGKTVDAFFTPSEMNVFYGPAAVVRLQGSRWSPVESMPGQFVWRVTQAELQEALSRATGKETAPEKLLLTADKVPLDGFGNHDQNYALVLTAEAASWLVESSRFNAYGTSWKSTDYEPGSRNRPIHEIIFSQAIIFECLDLMAVPEGVYFLCAFPLPLMGASESPVCPVLFTKDEIKKAF